MASVFNNDAYSDGIDLTSLPADYKSPYTSEQVFKYLDKFLEAKTTFIDMIKDPSKREFLQNSYSDNLSSLEKAVTDGKLEPWMSELRPANYDWIFNDFFSRESPGCGSLYAWLGCYLPNALRHLKTTEGFKNFEEIQPDVATELMGALETSAKSIVGKIHEMELLYKHDISKHGSALVEYGAYEGATDVEKLLASYDALRTVYNEVQALHLE